VNDETKYIVETINLTKKYGNTTAVNNLNLKIEDGTIYGLLGPNGAGKTTTILMLLGLTEPDSGKAFVSGYDTLRNPLEVKSLVGYLPDNVGFYDELSGEDNLLYTASLNGIDMETSRKRIKEALDKVGLSDAGYRKVGEYSRGMRQRLGIADVLIKNPKLIIMDEPTLGIDPEGIHELLGLIKNLAKESGRTILISSHLLHQIQQICDKVGIFVKGNLVASGTLNELEEQLLSKQEIEIELKATPNNKNLIKICSDIQGVEQIKWDNDLILLKCTKDIRKELSETLIAENYCPVHLVMRGVSLDSIYLRYFHREGMVYNE
jgi:ABC-2 type transport system ATP-binding protein